MLDDTESPEGRTLDGTAMPWLVALLIILLPSVAATAHAQVAAGERIRLTIGATRTEEGTFVRMDSSAVILTRMEGTDTLRIPTASVSRLEVSAGRYRRGENRVGKGMLAGAAIGFGVGLHAAQGSSSQPENSDIPPALGSGVGAVICAAAGAAIGAVVGMLASRGTIEEWREVGLGERAPQRTPDEHAAPGDAFGRMPLVAP